MDCLSFSDPCRDVTFKKSHQVGGTEIEVNLFGYVVDQRPCPAVIVLPTIEEATKYDRVKLTPTIEATPALNAKVRAQRSRDESGSTMSFKRYPGGYTQLTGANSSVGLQMISARVLIAEEISGWPQDAGNRGDPLAQVEKRLWEKALGPDHPEVATGLNNLAALYQVRARYAEAEPLYQRSLAIREKTLGPEHPDVATSLNNLAEIYRAQGKYSDAEPLYQRSLVIREKALGREQVIAVELGPTG